MITVSIESVEHLQDNVCRVHLSEPLRAAFAGPLPLRVNAVECIGGDGVMGQSHVDIELASNVDDGLAWFSGVVLGGGLTLGQCGMVWSNT